MERATGPLPSTNIFSKSHMYSMIKIYNKHIQPKIGAKKIDQIVTKDLQAIV
jgi:hypothetical protein